MTPVSDGGGWCPLELRGLGTVEAWHDGTRLPLGGAKQRGLLTLLMLEPNRVLPADRLIDRLWPHGQLDRNTLRRLASRLRQALASAGDDLVVGQSGGYLLAVDPEQVDLHRFERMVRSGLRELAAGNLDTGAGLLAEALSLWRGPAALTGVPETVREAAATRLEELRAQAIEERVGADLRRGRHETLLPELRQLLAEFPWRERVAGQLMTALYRSGRRAEALEVFDKTRHRMVDELGLEPSPELRELQAAILRAENQPAQSTAGAVARDREPAPPAMHAAGPEPPRQLPLALSGFVGRRIQLRQLDDLLTAGEQLAPGVTIAAITGTAGVGKTTLAVRWSHQIAYRYPDGQLYVNLRGFDPSGQIVSTADAVRRLLDALSVPPQRIPADLEAQLGLYRSVLAGRRILILLDNARDSDHVRALLPGSPGCLVLVTSRDHLSGLSAAEAARILVLDPLTLDEGRELLTYRLGADRTTTEPEATDTIVRLCAGLPLALAVAAARGATQSALSLETLAADLHRSESRLDVLANSDPVTDVRAVLSWSHRTLSPDAARLFRLLGVHPGPDIGVSAAASLAGVPVSAVRRQLAELSWAHLVMEQVPGRYTFHDLLRSYAVELAGEPEFEQEREAGTRRVHDHYVHAGLEASQLLNPHQTPLDLAPRGPGVTTEHLADETAAEAWFAAEYHVLMLLVEQAAREREDAVTYNLAGSLADFLQLKGLRRAQVAVQNHALRAAFRLGDPWKQATCHRYLGTTYHMLGRNQVSHWHLRRALSIFAEIGDWRGQASSHYDLAALATGVGDHELAIDHAYRSLELNRANGRRLGEALALNFIGYTYALLGKYEQALIDCAEALSIFQSLRYPRAEAATLDSLGYAHHRLGHHAEAARCYQQALDVSRQCGYRDQEAGTLRHLGDAYLAADRPDQARATWEEALEIFQDLQDQTAVEELHSSLGRLNGTISPAPS